MPIANPSYHGSYLMPSLDHATVADAMHPGILSCEPDLSLTEVAQIMASNHVHCVVVIGISHEEPECPVWGLISDVDLVKAGVRDRETTARGIAAEPLISVDPRMPLREAAELMLGQGTSHVVAIDPESERPIGILSTLDIAGIIAWGED
jgi:CBS domain-containing protein